MEISPRRSASAWSDSGMAPAGALVATELRGSAFWTGGSYGFEASIVAFVVEALVLLGAPESRAPRFARRRGAALLLFWGFTPIRKSPRGFHDEESRVNEPRSSVFHGWIDRRALIAAFLSLFAGAADPASARVAAPLVHPGARVRVFVADTTRAASRTGEPTSGGAVKKRTTHRELRRVRGRIDHHPPAGTRRAVDDPARARPSIGSLGGAEVEGRRRRPDRTPGRGSEAESSPASSSATTASARRPRAAPISRPSSPRCWGSARARGRRPGGADGELLPLGALGGRAASERPLRTPLSWTGRNARRGSRFHSDSEPRHPPDLYFWRIR